MSVVAFPDLPPAWAPAEALGRSRSDVAMLVATRSDGQIRRARFTELPSFLRPGDLLVVNTSATLAAALPARLDGTDVIVHVSTPLARDRWVVELRADDLSKLARPPLGTGVDLPDGGRLVLVAPHRGSGRLAEARIEIEGDPRDYLARHAAPIRYRDAEARWPLAAYQTIFAADPGSAEMPSAGRAFTHELVTDLLVHGMLLAPVTLHAGVSSLERGEDPYPERYRVPPATARLVNAVHGWGGRVIAVGTTVVRALEAAAGEAASGWTDLVITPERGLHVVDGLLTGWHEPESSHLLMLEAVAGRDLLERSYVVAAEDGLSGHESGDMHLIL